jgi:hypothetical protein
VPREELLAGVEKYFIGKKSSELPGKALLFPFYFMSFN